jgi:hypothetical protein
LGDKARGFKGRFLYAHGCYPEFKRDSLCREKATVPAGFPATVMKTGYRSKNMDFSEGRISARVPPG